MIIQILTLIIFSLCSYTEALESSRIDELNKEYQMGAKQGYGPFINELKSKLQTTTDLKEAARLATLIRGYIHGQIIGFDKTKRLTETERRAVLQAHATTTAFFTLSPLGTDRYREDTLRYVMKDVHGLYAQELTIVADAVQAALWAGDAGTREHVTNEVFLRWMTPAYQRGGSMDVSQALGDWGYENHETAWKLVNSTINYLSNCILDFSSGTLKNPLWRNDYPSPLIKNQIESIRKVAPAGKIIPQPGDGQCGFFSVSAPPLRNADNYSGRTQISKKFIDSLDRAYYDPALFWMLVAYADASNPSNKNWQDPKYKCLHFEKSILNDPRVQEAATHQLLSKNLLYVKEIDMLFAFYEALSNQNPEAHASEKEKIRKWKEFQILIVNEMPYANAEIVLNEVARFLSEKTQELKQKIKTIKNDKYYDWIRSTYNPSLDETSEMKDFEETQRHLAEIRNLVLRDLFMNRSTSLDAIPLSIKKEVIEMAKACAAYAMYSNAANTTEKTNMPPNIKSSKDVTVERVGNQLEIKPGDDVYAPDVVGLILETLISYVNDQSIYVLCTNRVNVGEQKISEKEKIGNYFLGKKVTRISTIKDRNFGKIYTINFGGAGGGHFEVYSTNDTPTIQLANALRNPLRGKEEWDLIQSATNHNKTYSSEIQTWTNDYIQNF